MDFFNFWIEHRCCSSFLFRIVVMHIKGVCLKKLGLASAMLLRIYEPFYEMRSFLSKYFCCGILQNVSDSASVREIFEFLVLRYYNTNFTYTTFQHN